MYVVKLSYTSDVATQNLRLHTRDAACSFNVHSRSLQALHGPSLSVCAHASLGSWVDFSLAPVCQCPIIIEIYRNTMVRYCKSIRNIF